MNFFRSNKYSLVHKKEKGGKKGKNGSPDDSVHVYKTKTAEEISAGDGKHATNGGAHDVTIDDVAPITLRNDTDFAWRRTDGADADHATPFPPQVAPRSAAVVDVAGAGAEYEVEIGATKFRFAIKVDAGADGSGAAMLAPDWGALRDAPEVELTPLAPIEVASCDTVVMATVAGAAGDGDE